LRWFDSFNPRPPDGGRLPDTVIIFHLFLFQSTPPGWRATFFHQDLRSLFSGFNPRPPDGGRPTVRWSYSPPTQFQSTPPGWRATSYAAEQALYQMGVSIHAPRMEGDNRGMNESYSERVSIHAPRMEGDLQGQAFLARAFSFNPRPPDGGRLYTESFQRSGKNRFNPRPPDGGRHQHYKRGKALVSFNPRPPDGGRPDFRLGLLDGIVSIHAPRMEGDTGHKTTCAGLPRFNPRPPDGGRPTFPSNLGSPSTFQSTPPGWRATQFRVVGLDTLEFQSTPPGWRATPPACSTSTAYSFQSTPPGWRATSGKDKAKQPKAKFQSTPPGWRATSGQSGAPNLYVFQSTPPGWRATQTVGPGT